MATRMTRTTVRFVTRRSVCAASAELAPEEAERRGDAAADHEAGYRRADDRCLLVLGELRPPVGELLHLRLKVGDRVRQLAPRLLDRGSDLCGRTLRHQLCSRISARVRLASSIAMSGVGGEPFLIQRSPRKPATPASAIRIPNTIRNPIHGLVLTQSPRSLKNHASASKK